MRRILLLAVLFVLLASCATKPVYVEGGRPGSTGGAQACREVSRIRCDDGNCGSNQDFVTLRCAAGTVTRCEANTGCKVR